MHFEDWNLEGAREEWEIEDCGEGEKTGFGTCVGGSEGWEDGYSGCEEGELNCVD